MIEVSSISLAVDSTRVVRAKSDLQAFARAGGEAERAVGGIEAATRRLGPALGSVFAGFTIGAAIRQADEFTNIAARMRLATKSAEEFATAQVQVFAIAQQTGTGLAATADLYGALARNTQELGASQAQVLDVTRTISQAMVVSGASAQSAQAALVQLGQAFASGTLRGEELNSVLEQSPRLARAIADGLNVTVGSLRTLGQDGALTARQVFDALQKSAAAVSAEFEQMPLTVGRATTEAANSLLVLLGAIDSTTGATSSLARVLSDAAAGMASLAQQIQLAYTGQETAANAAGRLAEAFITASEAVRILYANVEFVLTAIGRDVGAVAAQIVALGTLDIDGFNAISRAVRDDAQRARAELDAFERRVLSRYNFSDKAGAGRGFINPPGGVIQSDARRNAAGGKKGGSDKAAEAARREAEAIARAQLAADLDAIKSALDQRTSIYRASERTLAALRQAGLIDERQFIESKRQFITLESEAQIQALEAERARLQQQSVKGAEAIAQKQRIAQIDSRIAIERADAASRLYDLDIQQAGALRELARAYQAAEQAARDLLQSQALQQAQAIGSIGLSDRQRDRAQGRQQIDDRYLGQRQALEEKRLTSQITAEQYAEELDRIGRFQSASIASYEAYYDRLVEAQGQWSAGADRSLQNYVDQASMTANLVEEAMTRGLGGMEDAIVRFVTTGKLSFSDLATSVVADITRIIVKQTIANALVGAFGGGGSGAGGILGSIIGGLFGGGGGSGMPDGVPTRGGRARGGRVESGGMYPVNELARHGPGEILTSGGRQYLMARQDGYVQPMALASSGMQVVNNFHITGPVDRRTQQQIATAAGRGAQQAMARNG
jgi:lambda family phage tail tape measure protein